MHIPGTKNCFLGLVGRNPQLKTTNPNSTLDLEEGEAFYDMRDKRERRQPSWQRSGVVSQQRLRLRRLTFVKSVPKLRFEPVAFLFLAYWIPIFWTGQWGDRPTSLTEHHVRRKHDWYPGIAFSGDKKVVMYEFGKFL